MTAQTRFTLADTLAYVLPDVPPGLISAENSESLLNLARTLPPIPHILLECRLAEHGPIDLSLCVSDAEIDSSLMQHYLAPQGKVSTEWRRVLRFIDWWCSNNEGSNRLNSTWLEFDADPDQKGLPPAIFLPLNPSAKPLTAKSMGVADALEKLLPGGGDKLDYWLQRLPPQAVPTFVGVMLSRQMTKLRLNIAALGVEHAWDWMVANGKPDSHAKQVFNAMYRLAGKPILTVDVDENVGTRVGLECRPQTEDDSQAMFGQLVSHGLSSKEQYGQLQSWAGYSSAFGPGKKSAAETSLADQTTPEWPVHLVLEAIIRSDTGASVLLRRLNHVKLVFEESGMTEAKAYLGLNHVIYTGGNNESSQDQLLQCSATKNIKVS